MAMRKYVSYPLLVFVCALMMRAQSGNSANSKPGETSPDTVVALVDGVEYTAGDIDRIRAALPSEFKRHTAHLTNQGFIEHYRRVLGLARAAEKAGIHEKEPYRTQLEYNRLNFLAGVYTSEMGRSLQVPNEESRDYYEQHKSDFEEVRVSAIYVDYSRNPQQTGSESNPALSEQEARAKAEKLHAELKNGADFAELAKQHSSDSTSAAKGGDLGFFKPDTSLPLVVRRAIFGLQEGEISEAVNDGQRYFIFKATERRAQPYNDVAVDVVSRLHSAKMVEKVKEAAESIAVEYKDEKYLEQRPTRPTGRTRVQVPRPKP